MAKQKVKGIRSRGNTFMVDVTVDGKRSTKGGFKSYDDALAYIVQSHDMHKEKSEEVDTDELLGMETKSRTKW